MNERIKKHLQSSLTKAMNRWLDEVSEDDEISLPCLVGDSAASFMADAAFAVLAGIADAQEYLASEGMLNED